MAVRSINSPWAFTTWCLAISTCFLAALVICPNRVWAERTAAVQATTHEAPQFTDTLRSRYAAQIRQRSHEQRISTIRELGKYPDIAAVRLVLQYGLRDRQSHVNEAAQLALLNSRGQAEIERFLLEQLRLELINPKASSADYRQRLIRLLGRFHTSTMIRDMLAIGDRVDRATRDQLLEAVLDGIDEGAAQRDLSLVAVLRDLMKTAQFADTPGLQRCVIDAACAIPSSEAVSLLINRLDDLDGDQQHDVMRHLRRVTRQELALDPDAWTAWWRANSVEFEFPAKLLEGSPPDEAQGAPLYYYDIPIHARHIVFVLDSSRSMGTGGTVSRLEAAKRELVKTIEKLPDDALFNVVVFNSEVVRWQEHMRTATAGNKVQAAAFIRAQKPNGKTATYDALHSALGMGPNLEAIFFLSDGAPSDGSIVAPDAVLAAIRQENRLRRLKIHTLGAFGGQQAAGLEDFMRKLAEQNHGQFRRLD